MPKVLHSSISPEKVGSYNLRRLQYCRKAVAENGLPNDTAGECEEEAVDQSSIYDPIWTPVSQRGKLTLSPFSSAYTPRLHTADRNLS